MPSIVKFAGNDAELEREADSWLETHDLAGSRMPLLERVILDLIDRLGYLPHEAAAVLGLPLPTVLGTFWTARRKAAAIANRLSTAFRDDPDLDPRNVAIFELQTVCDYTFVELSEVLRLNRGHVCRVANELVERLRSRLSPPDEFDPQPSPDEDDDAEVDETLTEGLSYLSQFTATDDAAAAAERRLNFARNCVLTPIQRAELVQEMLDAGDFRFVSEIAAAIGIDEGTLRNDLRLLRVPADWRDRVARGEIPLCFLRPLVGLDEKALTKAERLLQSRGPMSYRMWRRAVAAL